MQGTRVVDLSVSLPSHIAQELETMRRESPERLQRVLTVAALEHRCFEVLARDLRGGERRIAEIS